MTDPKDHNGPLAGSSCGHARDAAAPADRVLPVNNHGKSDDTRKQYKYRYDCLLANASTYLTIDGPLTDMVAFAWWLITIHRPTLTSNSWRVYRAAALYGLELAQQQPEADESIGLAIARLKGTIADGSNENNSARNNLRTSATKDKNTLEDELERVRFRVLSTRSKYKKILSDQLLTCATWGLRLEEGATAEFGPSNVPGMAYEMLVQNGKFDENASPDEGRAHGPTRTLRMAELDPELVRATSDWLSAARAAQNRGELKALISRLQTLMREATEGLFSRKQRPTPTTPRHMAAARWEAAYVPPDASPEERELGMAIVAALLGHATDETAPKHYRRASKGCREPSRYPVPQADPAEVGRVRPKRTASLDRFADWSKQLASDLNAAGIENFSK